MKTRNMKNKRGQAMVEYIIIVVIVAIAAIAVFGVFGDRLRQMVGGATEELGGDADSATSESSIDLMKGMDENGMN